MIQLDINPSLFVWWIYSTYLGWGEGTEQWYHYTSYTADCLSCHSCELCSHCSERFGVTNAYSSFLAVLLLKWTNGRPPWIFLPAGRRLERWRDGNLINTSAAVGPRRGRHRNLSTLRWGVRKLLTSLTLSVEAYILCWTHLRLLSYRTSGHW